MKTENIWLRVSAEQKATLAAAAKEQGLSLSSFVLWAALRKISTEMWARDGEREGLELVAVPKGTIFNDSLAIYGSPGSGKSTSLLQAVTAAVAEKPIDLLDHLDELRRKAGSQPIGWLVDRDIINTYQHHARGEPVAPGQPQPTRAEIKFAAHNLAALRALLASDDTKDSPRQHQQDVALAAHLVNRGRAVGICHKNYATPTTKAGWKKLMREACPNCPVRATCPDLSTAQKEKVAQ
jgi:hypothetical protein